jgi:5-methylthioribose kinase
MLELTPESAALYLCETGRIPDDGRSVAVRALGWGVSNVVLRVDVEGESPFILKQARERLRTKAHWVSRLDRIWTERAALELLADVLPEGVVPRVLFSDQPNYVFAMSCAPDDSVVWKEQLLADRCDPAIARRAGAVLGTIHQKTRNHPALEGRLAETEVFDQLRIDPFYREVARVHPEIAPGIDALIGSMAAAPARCLVLGDFSPKNILVHSRGLTLVDFETAHAGDPAYDVGFFLSHLMLKSLRDNEPGRAERADRFHELMAAFLAAYDAQNPAAEPDGRQRDDSFEPPPGAARWHMLANALARVDGKSPVDYLSEPVRGEVRRVCLEKLQTAALR